MAKLAYIERKLEIKFVEKGAPAGTFSGYGAVFNNVDSYGDVIAPGAFKNTLNAWKARGSMPKMLLQHGGFIGPAEDGIPIGKWNSMAEDSKGLEVEGNLFALDTQKGKYIYEGLKSQALDGLSIGYIPVGVKYGQTSTDPERTLMEVDLHECSVVTFPANDKALISQCKSGSFGKLDQLSKLAELEDFLRDAGGFSHRQAKTFLSQARRVFGLSQSDSGGQDGVEDEMKVIEAFRKSIGLS